MKPIETERDIRRALKALLAADPRLIPVADIAGPLTHRRQAGGFEGIASIITSQQISIAAAASIWGRFKAAVDPFTPKQFLLTPEDALRAVGLSRPKIRTLAGIAAAAADGFDLVAVHDLPTEQAMATMTALKGIGSWTAEIYLLFCVGHPDIFPAGDLALQSAAHHGLKLSKRPERSGFASSLKSGRPGVASRRGSSGLIIGQTKPPRKAAFNL